MFGWLGSALESVGGWLKGRPAGTSTQTEGKKPSQFAGGDSPAGIRGRDPRMFLVGAAPGSWASSHLRESESLTGWSFVAIRSLARMCSQSVLHVHEAGETAERRRRIKKAMRLSRTIGDRRGFKRWKSQLKRLRKSENAHEKDAVSPDHPFRRLLERPNPEWSGSTFMFAMVQQMALTGSALIWVVRNGAGIPKELYVLPTGLCTPRLPSVQYPFGSRWLTPLSSWGLGPVDGVWGSGALGNALLVGTEIDNRDIKIIKDPHPIYLSDGLSPLAAGAVWIDILAEMDRANWALLQNSERPGQIFSQDTSEGVQPSEAEIVRFREDLRAEHAGTPNTGKNLLLPPGITAETRSRSAEELDFATARKDYRDASLALHGMTAISAGVAEGGSYSAFWASIKQTTEQTVQPTLDKIGQELSHLLGASWQGPRCEAAYKAKRVDDPQLKQQTASLLIQSGNGCTVGEWRHFMMTGELALKPLPNELADQLIGEKRSVSTKDEDPTKPGNQGPDGKTAPSPVAAAADKPAPSSPTGGTGVRDETKDASPGMPNSLAKTAALLNGRGGVKVSPNGQTVATEEATPHKYASTHIALPRDIANRVRLMAACIDDADLAEDGREDNPHITTLYGLTSDDPVGVMEALAGTRPVAVKLGGLSLFQNDDADVLKIDIESPDLHALNATLSTLDHKKTHPEYNPHCTVAYLKPGCGEYYLDMANVLRGKEFVASSVVFSDRTGKETHVRLSGRKAHQPNPPFDGGVFDEQKHRWVKPEPGDSVSPPDGEAIDQLDVPEGDQSVKDMTDWIDADGGEHYTTVETSKYKETDVFRFVSVGPDGETEASGEWKADHQAAKREAIDYAEKAARGKVDSPAVEETAGVELPPHEQMHKADGIWRGTLWRASDDDIVVESSSFSADSDAAMEYLNNPGFGGKNFWKTDIAVDEKEVVDLFEMDEEDAIALVGRITERRNPGGIGIDEWVPRVAADLRGKGFQWVRVRESYPAGSETWIFVGDDDPDMQEVVGVSRKSDPASYRKGHQDQPPHPGLVFDEQRHRWVKPGDTANDTDQAGAGDTRRDVPEQNIPTPADMGEALPSGPPVSGGENVAEGAAPGEAGKATPRGKSFFSGSEHWDGLREMAAGGVSRWMADAEKSGVPPEKLAFYRRSMDAVLDNMPAGSMAAFLKNTEKVVFMGGVSDVTREFYEGKKGDSIIGGFYLSYTGDPQGVIYCDGGADTGEDYHTKGQSPEDTAGIYAHEIGHAVEGPGLVIRDTPEWKIGWKEEIWGDDSLADEQASSWRLTRYAAKNEGDGFAEYFRLVCTDPEKARDQFPRCWAVLEKRGLV